MSRQRQWAWAIGGVIVGILLVLRLGTVGVWGGYVMIAIGLFRAYELVQTFRNPAGKIVVSKDKVSLPRGVHRPMPIVVAPSDVTAVYFLRKSVPWNRAAPVLVIELGERALLYPRDWFASEADQRHVVHALLQHRPASETAPAGEAAPASEASLSTPVVIEPSKKGELIGGLALIAIGVVGSAIGYAQASPGGSYRLFIGPIVAGALLFWRGLDRR